MIKLSISNIAWAAPDDDRMYAFLKDIGYAGLEIAPTRIFTDAPYDRLPDASAWAKQLHQQYGLAVSSMQSICFGRDEAVFGTQAERIALFGYIKQAIDFAAATGCGNLVFGSPKNRIIAGRPIEIAYEFFGKLGDYAAAKNTVLAFEPNPDIYGTDFINTTTEAFDFVKQINSSGLMVNFDLGTFLHNGEKIEIIEKNLDYINHIHISEPYLEKIQHRQIHKQIAQLLINKGYDRYVSIEMKNGNDTDAVQETALYIKEIFHAVSKD